MDIQIRTCSIIDFEPVLELFHQLWPGKDLHKKELAEVFARSINSTKDEYLCAELEGKIIGFCAYGVMESLWQAGTIAYIYALVVDQKVRNRGVGKSLIHRAADSAKLRGCKLLELDSGFQREGAHRFYEKIGFVKRAYLFSKEL